MASLDGGTDVSETPDRVKRFFDQRKRAEEGTWTMPESMAPGSASRARDLHQPASIVWSTSPSTNFTGRVPTASLGPLQWPGEFPPRAGTRSATPCTVLRNVARGGAVLFAFAGFLMIPSALPAGIFFLSLSIAFLSAVMYLRDWESQAIEDTIVEIEGSGATSNWKTSNNTLPIAK